MPRVHALVAVKELTRAKSRLGGEFPAALRGELVLAMLRDTVTTALAVPDVASVTVVSPDPDVLAAARASGAASLLEPPSRRRLNDALRHAAEHVRERCPAVDLVALQADLPAMSVDELTDALAGAQGYRRSIVADHRGSGTCALVVRGSALDSPALAPPALDPAFGPDSARAHIRSGAVSLPGAWPGLRRDVDTRADLAAAVELGVGSHTRAALTHIGWPHPCPH